MIRKQIQRREFLSQTAKSVMSAGLAMPLIEIAKSDKSNPPNPDKSVQKKNTLEFRELGKTGLKVTTISYGAMRTRDEAIIHRALDLGINYIDTARSYMGGQNEKIVGNVLKTRRKEAYIATKFKPRTVQENIESVETSLKALQTDYLDIIQAHGLDTVSEVTNEEILETLRRVKKDGKVRFVGFTTHSNETELVLAAIKLNFYDMILVAYNFEKPAELSKAIEEAAKSGIGIVAMKTQAGGYTTSQTGNLSPHQAALKWVLQNKGVATTIPSMVNYDQLNEDIQVMGSKMGWMDRKTLFRYGQAIKSFYCRMCGECRNQCPQGARVEDINRAIMYHDGYGDSDLASETYHALPLEVSALPCTSCSSCSVRCPHGLDIHFKMNQAFTLFSEKKRYA